MSDTTNDATGEEIEKDIPFMKAYTVFNADQVEGLPEHYYAKPTAPTEPVESRSDVLDRFFAAAGVPIREGGNRAFYAIHADFVQMPPYPAPRRSCRGGKGDRIRGRPPRLPAWSESRPPSRKTEFRKDIRCE